MLLRSLIVLVAMAVTAGFAAASPVDDGAQAVVRLERQRSKLAAGRTKLSTHYQTQVQQIETVRRERSSWSRDRRLRKLRSSAKETEKRLTRADEQLREVDVWLRRARRELVSFIDTELQALPPQRARRRKQLLALRTRTRSSLGHKQHKIVLPSHSIDPLADADELAEQRSLIERTDRDLAREEQLLVRREQRYRRMAALQRQRRRVDELDVFDEQPRGTTARPGGNAEPSPTGDGFTDDSNPSPPSDSAEDPGEPAGAGNGDADSDPKADSDPTVVLADVVDQDTLSAMKRADRSDDPLAKADAAARARAQVRSKRAQLQRVRALVDRRIRTLRGR